MVDSSLRVSWGRSTAVRRHLYHEMRILAGINRPLAHRWWITNGGSAGCTRISGSHEASTISGSRFSSYSRKSLGRSHSPPEGHVSHGVPFTTSVHPQAAMLRRFANVLSHPLTVIPPLLFA